MRPGGSSAQDLLAVQQEMQKHAELEDLIRRLIHDELREIRGLMLNRGRGYGGLLPFEQSIADRILRLDEWMLVAVDRIENGGSA